MTGARATEFFPLSSVDPQELASLINDPRVRRHMPLCGEPLSVDQVREWAAGKDHMLKETGIGPRAILVDGTLAGWGGLQPEGQDIELALVLSPAFWGTGRAICDLLLIEAFETHGLSQVIILLPSSRTRVAGIRKLGFEQASTRVVEVEEFVVFKLDAS